MSRTRHARRESNESALKENLANAIRERDAYKKAYEETWRELQALKHQIHPPPRAAEVRRMQVVHDLTNGVDLLLDAVMSCGRCGALYTGANCPNHD